MFTAIPKNGQTWLICGGREFCDTKMFDAAMSEILSLKGCPDKIVHGAARGADSLAHGWGHRMALEVISCPADWNKYGRSAGPIRNQEMLTQHNPDFIIAFPGGTGTADMKARGRNAGIDVCEIRPRAR